MRQQLAVCMGHPVIRSRMSGAGRWPHKGTEMAATGPEDRRAAMGTKRVSLTVWLVWAAIAVGFVAAMFTGRALYDHGVIGAVPMGSETAIYVGPCTVQPLQLTGTCNAERGQS